MSFVTLMHWAAEGNGGEAIVAAKGAFVPIMMSAGADSVEVVQTGDFKVCVVAHYSSAKLAEVSLTKVAELRKGYPELLRLKLSDSLTGQIIESAWPTV